MRNRRPWSYALCCMTIALVATGCGESDEVPMPNGPTTVEAGAAGNGVDRGPLGRWRGSLDRRLERRLRVHRVDPPDDPGPFDPDRVELGRMLFFDKELSGNRDIACATCHHPRAVSGDGLALAVGVAGSGKIPNRRRGHGQPFVPRNSPELFVRGLAGWETMFWDGRVEETPSGRLSTPAGSKLQSGLDGVIAAQAMFPVTSRDEMRGHTGDGNELSSIPDGDFATIWSRLMDRLLAIPGYRQLFRDAFPQTSLADLKFRDAANAIADFEKAAFHYLDSPFDRYLRGDKSALTDRQKRGALLFYGEAGCASCHSGRLMTDQQFHNIGAPQIGPGKAPYEPLDPGRFLVDNHPRNKFAFRTPPLRNVELTGPYLHSGAYDNLRDVIEHHLRPRRSLRRYDGSELRPAVRTELHDSPTVTRRVLRGLDWRLRLRSRIQQWRWHPWKIDDGEVDELVAFLKSLTSPSAGSLDAAITPESVPSGLFVDE